jgi:hypothetical protein
VTLDDANARLPLVRAVVKDAMEHWRELRGLRAHVGRLRREGAEEGELGPLTKRWAELEEALHGYVRELEEIGAVIKDFDQGLVDFPANVGSRRVLLCWKAGEDCVAWWHEESAGFAGRKPISELR